MKNRNVASLFLFFLFFIFHQHLSSCDLTVVGDIDQADGLGRISIGIIDTLRNDLSINYVQIGRVCFDDVNDNVKEIVLDSLSKTSVNPGNVSILTFFPAWAPQTFFQFVPNSPIKIAYSMFDTTQIPLEWVDIFNQYFDAVIVPDRYLIKVYENSGVQIPVFFLPLGMYLDDFFQKKKSNLAQHPFTFGSTSAFVSRKNLPLLIQAFKEEFQEKENVRLLVHGRVSESQLIYLASELNQDNIIVSQKVLNQKEYVELLSSFDCYVTLSKGEGFSCPPREALAMGIPCILSDNTAHHTICNSGFVRSVQTAVEEEAIISNPFYSGKIGLQFNCQIKDVRKALREVYENYKYYHKLARSGRKWVSKYTWENLRPKYLNLVKPKKIILGKKNSITNEYLMTNSSELFEKYQNVLKIK